MMVLLTVSKAVNNLKLLADAVRLYQASRSGQTIHLSMQSRPNIPSVRLTIDEARVRFLEVYPRRDDTTRSSSVNTTDRFETARLGDGWQVQHCLTRLL